MTVTELLALLESDPKGVEFTDAIQAIDSHYQFSETRFTNGDTTNDAGKNNGSCKILAFGQLHQLSPEATLACFGKIYFKEVLDNPDGSDHQNIRQFMIHGWSGVNFDHNPLTPINI